MRIRKGLRRNREREVENWATSGPGPEEANRAPLGGPGRIPDDPGHSPGDPDRSLEGPERGSEGPGGVSQGPDLSLEGPERGSEGSEPVDHTADVALRVRARSLEGLFREAALGLGRLLTDTSRVRTTERAALEIKGIDLEELLVAWLNEILYRSESGAMLFAKFEGLRIEKRDDCYRLEVVGIGERRDASRHAPGTAVKAATYHGLELDPESERGYDLIIVFDT